MKQSLRVFNPVVQVPVSTSQLAKLVSDFDSVIILDPTAESALTAANSLAGKVAIVVGPEGGIDSSELDTLTKAGASRVHLGRGILRTSTAGLVALSIIGSKAGSFDE
jgi:16S rRNA (uracil1498-N3)-methyltransferase